MALLSTSPVIYREKKGIPLEIDLGIKGSDLYHTKNQLAFLKAFSESMALKQLSHATRKIYLKGFKRFLSHHPKSDINSLSYRELYLYLKGQDGQMHPTVLKQTIAAIKFYYERTLGREKMFFAVAKNNKVLRFTLYLPFFDLKEIIERVASPGDKLLLFLVYHANIQLSEICKLPKDAFGLLDHKFCIPVNNVHAIKYFKALVEDCHKQYHLNTYLIENEGQAHNLTTLKGKLFRILAHYKIEEIYRKQYQLILKQTNFSARTRSMYLNVFMKLLRHFNYKHPAFISDENLRDYMAMHGSKTASQQNNLVSSFKLFFEKIHKRPLPPRLVVRPRKAKHLSEYCSQSEIAAMLGTTDNLKHKLLTELVCTIGLCQQEIQNLRVVDIDLKHNRIFVNESKGNPDRYFLFNLQLHHLLKAYLAAHKPKTYLLEGSLPGTKYSTTSMLSTLKNMAKAAGIQRNINIEMLRHSLASNLPAEGKASGYANEPLSYIIFNSNIATERYTYWVDDIRFNEATRLGRRVFQSGFIAYRNHSPPYSHLLQ